MAGSSAASRRQPAASRTVGSVASADYPASATISASRTSEFGCRPKNPRHPKRGNQGMTVMKDIEHFTIFKDPAHCVNQIATRLLKNGDILAVFNEERFP